MIDTPTKPTQTQRLEASVYDLETKEELVRVQLMPGHISFSVAFRNDDGLNYLPLEAARNFAKVILTMYEQAIP